MRNVEALRSNYPYGANVFTVFNKQLLDYDIAAMNLHNFVSEEDEMKTAMCSMRMFETALGYLGNEFPSQQVKDAANATFTVLASNAVHPVTTDDLATAIGMLTGNKTLADTAKLRPNIPFFIKLMAEKDPKPRQFTPNESSRVKYDMGLFCIVPHSWLETVSSNSVHALAIVAGLTSSITDFVTGMDEVYPYTINERVMGLFLEVYREALRINPKLKTEDYIQDLIKQYPNGLINERPDIFYRIPQLVIPPHPPHVYGADNPISYPQ